MFRGSCALVIVPNVELVFTPAAFGEKDVFGDPSCGWLNALNTSALNCKVAFSGSLKFLVSEAFVFVKFGPRVARKVLPSFPRV